MSNRKISLIDLIQDADIGAVLKQPTPGSIINYIDDGILGNNLTEEVDSSLEKEAVGLTSLHTSDIPANSSHRIRNTQEELEEDLDVAMRFFGGPAHLESPDSNPPININNNNEETINNKGDLTDKAASLSWPYNFFNKVTLGEKMNKEQRSIKKLYTGLKNMGFNAKAEEVLGLLEKAASLQVTPEFVEKYAAISEGDKDVTTARGSISEAWTELTAAVTSSFTEVNYKAIKTYMYETEEDTIAKILENDLKNWDLTKSLIDDEMTSIAGADNASSYYKRLLNVRRRLFAFADQARASKPMSVEGLAISPFSGTTRGRSVRPIHNHLRNSQLFWWFFISISSANEGKQKLSKFMRLLDDHISHFDSYSRQHTAENQGLWRYRQSNEVIYMRFVIEDENAINQVYKVHTYHWYAPGHEKRGDCKGAFHEAYPTETLKNNADFQEVLEHLREWNFTGPNISAGTIKKKSSLSNIGGFVKGAMLLDLPTVGSSKRIIVQELAVTNGLTYREDSLPNDQTKITITALPQGYTEAPWGSVTFDKDDNSISSTPYSGGGSSASNNNDSTNNNPPRPTNTGGKFPFDENAVTAKGHKISDHLPKDKELEFRKWVNNQDGLNSAEIKKALKDKNNTLKGDLSDDKAWRNAYTSTAWEIWGDSWLATVKPELFKEEEENAEFSEKAVQAFIFGSADHIWNEAKPEGSADMTRKELIGSYNQLKVLLDDTTEENRAEKLKKIDLIMGVTGIAKRFERALANAATAQEMDFADLNDRLELLHSSAMTPAESTAQAAGSGGGSGEAASGRSISLTESVYYNPGGDPLKRTVTDGVPQVSVAAGTVLTLRTDGNSFVMGTDGKLRPLYTRPGSPFLTEAEKKALTAAAPSQGGSGEWSQFLKDVTKVWVQRVNPNPGLFWESLKTNIKDLRENSTIGANYVASPEFKRIFPQFASAGNMASTETTDVRTPIARDTQ